MSYKAPQTDIALNLIENAVLAQGQVFTDSIPEWKSVKDHNVIAMVRLTGGESNPRWARDELFLNIQVMGRTRNNTEEARNLIFNIYNYLVGKDTFEIGDYAYLQFNSVVFPNLVGYQTNSAPLYSCSISLVREAQVKEGNRDPLC